MAAISSAADGTWIAGAATTWVGGVAPTEGDTATILNGHDVEIDGDITVGADSATAAILVNSGGSLFVPNTVAGNYTLTLKGDLKTDGTGGTISFGTAANPIPNTRTFKVLTNYSASLADGKYGIIIAVGGTFNCQGADRWANGLTDPDRTLLAANAAVNATSLTVADSTLWIDNDLIAIASTTTTYTQCEQGAMAATTVNTTLTVDGFAGVGGGLAYAHSGTSPTQAEIINLTRNVKITSYSTSNAGWLQLATSSTSDVDWTEFSYLGANASNKKGVNIQTTTGSCNFNRCSYYNFRNFGIYCEGASVNNFTINNAVGWNMPTVSVSNNFALQVDNTSGTNWTINNFWMIYTPYNYAFYLKDMGGTFTNILSAGSAAYGINCNISELVSGTFSNLTVHSSAIYSLTFTKIFGGTISNITAWHNGYGLGFTAIPRLNINTATLFGNVTYNIQLASAALFINDLKSNGTTSQATTYGITCSTGGGSLKIFTADFSTVAGIKTAHTTDIIVPGINAIFFQCRMINVKLGAATPVSLAYGTYDSYVQSMNHGQSAGVVKTWMTDETGAGITYTLEKDASYYNTAAPSIKITPASASYKQAGSSMRIPVASGANPTISVYFRKSAAYNGSQPRLIVKRNDALGIISDTVMATSAAAVDVDVAPGTFTQLSGQPGAVSADGVLEVYVDCDGTAGYINLDDWAVTGNI